MAGDTPTQAGALRFSFPEFLDRLLGELAPSFEPRTTDDIQDVAAEPARTGDDPPYVRYSEPAQPTDRTLVLIRQLFEAYVAANVPLSARMQRMAREVRRELEYIDALTNEIVEPLRSESGLFDPRVRILVLLNYWHAVETAGRKKANAELTAITKKLIDGKKGRPARISFTQVQEALRLREAEQLSYAAIATRIGLNTTDARALALAVRWHFPTGRKSD
jgi:hypothetical protein